MDGALPYLIPVLAFIAATVGIFGPAHKEGAHGFRGLTHLGWAALCLAAISAGVALLQARAAAKEQERFAAAAWGDLRDVTGEILAIIRYAEQIPDVTSAGGWGKYEESLPAPPPSPFGRGEWMTAQDLTSKALLARLRGIYLTPALETNANYTSEGWFNARQGDRVFERLAVETSSALGKLEVLLNGSLVKDLGADAVVAGRVVLDSHYLQFLQELETSYVGRADMEDTELPDVLDFTLIDSGSAGGSEQDFLILAEALKELYRQF